MCSPKLRRALAGTVVALVSCIVLSGCASLSSYPKSHTNVKAELAALEPWLSPTVVATYNNKPAADKRGYRDEVVNARIRATNLLFDEFERSIQMERKTGEIGTDWTVLALNGTASLLKPASTKSILSAVSGGVVGGKGSVDKNLFYEKTMPVLISQMEANRREVLVRLREGMTQEVDRYPLSHALIDLEDYYKAGTLPAAVIAINASSGESIKASDKSLRAVIEGTYVKDDAGTLLREFWKPAGGEVNKDNEKALTDWMTRNNIKDVSIPFFLRSTEYAKERGKAVKDLNLKSP